jgi:hypothetical protein
MKNEIEPKTIRFDCPGKARAADYASALALASKWFVCTPLPGDVFEFEVKNEPGLSFREIKAIAERALTFHAIGTNCSICSPKMGLFATVHVPPPPCAKCQSQNTGWTGLNTLACADCGHTLVTVRGL